MQRTKGAAGEREIVNLLKQYGINAKRISMMETNGEDKGDISIYTHRRPGDVGQVKRGNHVPKFIYQALGDFDFLFCRRDKERWLVTMDVDTFIYFMQENEKKS